ncbi:hypothetical protein B0H14DRAFT_2873081, partial [Mycena olivaceomarginata]
NYNRALGDGSAVPFEPVPFPDDSLPGRLPPRCESERESTSSPHPISSTDLFFAFAILPSFLPFLPFSSCNFWTHKSHSRVPPSSRADAHAAHERRRHRRARDHRARGILQSVLPSARIHRIRGRGRAGGGRGGRAGKGEREGAEDRIRDVRVRWLLGGLVLGMGGGDCTGDGGGGGGEEDDKGASASGNRGEDGPAPDPAYAALGL